MTTIKIPPDLKTVLNAAWKETQKVPGHLGENEARFLGLLAACVPARGTIVEIGSFKGRSTVMLAKVASHYGLGPVVAIDPHNSPILLDHHADPESSSYKDFLNSIHAAGVSNHVESHVAYSTDVASLWKRPIRLLWIDGDHSYEGAKNDFHGFFPHLVPHGVVALHDALNAFPGPIRVFVEEILGSDGFGPAGFVHSIAWAQFRAGRRPCVPTTTVGVVAASRAPHPVCGKWCRAARNSKEALQIEPFLGSAILDKSKSLGLTYASSPPAPMSNSY